MPQKDSARQVPSIVTALPGPRAQRLIASDQQFTSPSYTRVYPLAVASGRGATIEDVDGNLFLDFTAGIAVCSTGHCHPRVVAQVQRQAGQLLHMSGTDFYYRPQAALAEKLASIAPTGRPNRVFFTNSGAESVEAAFKLARYHTGRRHVIAFFGSFHGRTMGALSLTASKITQRQGFAPLIPQVTHIPFPNPFRQGSDCVDRIIEHLQGHVFRQTVPPEEVAAIVVEPIQGEGGYIVPPDDFHPRLSQLAREHGILYVVDEVQSGMGRTGKMFAMEHWGVEPDIFCLAKGIASGLPLGAIVAPREVMSWPHGAHASTFGGNPVSCTAALETIALLEEELIENAENVGQFLQSQLEQLAQRHQTIGQVRGMGLMVAIELVRDRRQNVPDPKLQQRVVDGCFQQGLLLLGCGESTIRFCPPLVIGQDEVRTAVAILDRVLQQES